MSSRLFLQKCGVASAIFIAVWASSGSLDASERTAFGGNTQARPAVEAGRALGIAPTDDELMRVGLFAQPLIPVGTTNPEENRELATLITAYQRAAGRGESDAVQPFEQFLREHPQSAWKASLQVNLGAVYRRTGHFSKALETWQAAWDSSKGFTDRNGRAVGDIAVGYLSQLEANYGRKEALSALLAEVKQRPVRGSATELVTESATGLADMGEHPELAFKCGPSALARILALKPSRASHDGLQVLERSRSTPDGLSLNAVQAISVQAGMNYQMAYRSPGAAMVVPAVVHWKVDHYAAVLGKDRSGRFLIGDPTFGEDIVISPSTLEEEASGYYLVPPGPLPKGWRVVDASEGGKIWGRGDTGNNHDQGATGPGEPPAFPCGGPPPSNPDGGGGCAIWNVEAEVTSLTLHDNPVGYKPPIGPRIDLSMTYSHRDAMQPSVFTYTNFGNKWNNEWISSVDVNSKCDFKVVGGFYTDMGSWIVAMSVTGALDFPSPPLSPCDVLHRRGGGSEPFTYPNNIRTSYEGQFSQSSLTRLVDAKGNVTSIQRQFPDGSIERFTPTPPTTNGCGVSCQLFMTEVDDPQGNAVKISYDSLTRIVSLTDAIGQVTTFCYNDTWQTQPLLCKQPSAAIKPRAISRLRKSQIHLDALRFLAMTQAQGSLRA